MASNLFISYDLSTRNGARDYKPLFDAIHALGYAQHLELSQFFLSTAHPAKAVGDHLWSLMKNYDKLLVIDAKTNFATWYGLKNETGHGIRSHWST